MDNGASSYRRFLDGEENAFDEILTASPIAGGRPKVAPTDMAFSCAI